MNHPKKFVDWLKTINWQLILDVGQSLDDLNESQYRFVKGRVIELLLEKHSGGILTFVGEKHKDYVCREFNCTVELKSSLSNTLYTQKGKFKKRITVLFNNSMGTNKTTLPDSEVADWLILVYKNGVVLVDKPNVIKCAKSNGDGFVLSLTENDVIEITGPMASINIFSLNLKTRIDKLLYEVINNAK